MLLVYAIRLTIFISTPFAFYGFITQHRNWMLLFFGDCCCSGLWNVVAYKWNAEMPFSYGSHSHAISSFFRIHSVQFLTFTFGLIYDVHVLIHRLAVLYCSLALAIATCVVCFGGWFYDRATEFYCGHLTF